MISRPSLEELHTAARSDVSTRVGTSILLRRSLLGAITAALAGGLHGLYGLLLERARQSIPYSATGSDLESWASLWGLARKQPTRAVGAVTASGASGVLIAEGTRLQSASGTLYEVDADTTTVSGTASFAVSALDTGMAGNQSAATVLSWVNPPTGLAATVVVGAGGLAGGTNQESDDGLRARLLRRIQAPGHGGNADDYLNWALSVAPITRAWVFPLYDGPGSVRVYVANDSYAGATLASGGDVTAVQTYLDSVKPVTATAEAVAPTAAPVDYDLTISPDTAETRAAVTAALAELYFREAAPEAGLSLNRMIATIGNSGIDDFTMAAPIAAPTAAAGEILTLGEITWS